MHPDPKRLKQLNELIDKNKQAIFLTCLKEGITRKHLIEYLTRLCALKHLDKLLADPCPMKLVSEVEDLAEWRRMCPHQKRMVDKIKYGQSDFDQQDLWVWDFSKS
tara:strand:+ start:863 stop:1180 length:318 start_codon:yes stop_codon:yes gene_type:complete